MIEVEVKTNRKGQQKNKNDEMNFATKKKMKKKMNTLSVFEVNCLIQFTKKKNNSGKTQKENSGMSLKEINA